MGGRGSSSSIYNNRSSGKNLPHKLNNISEIADKRSDIQTMFVSQLGFGNIGGTNNIQTATIGSYGIALQKLEKKYNAIAQAESVTFAAGSDRTSNAPAAQVSWNRSNPLKMQLAINTAFMGNTKENIQLSATGEKTKFKSATDGRITSLNGRTITHEYGHILENVISVNTNKSHDKIAGEIKQIAKTRYNTNLKKPVSKYGNTNSSEFFAETFASLNSGGKSGYTLAMKD